ncbi:MAG: Sua5/YciO/YrdC/YwlC family protein [Bacteroidales bacterium]|nr:Sua5/YciO/YrdC/YwlC family protein [Bacteroidales bacterium]MBR1571073.1 Sua5/YciO/YrdC/YwlC family protein [Bacteroidales bacterium]
MKPEEIFAEALRTLREGGTILYPTDTVWGIGCDATNPEAVARIFEIKHRADSKSLVLLASDLDMVAKYVREIPSIAIDLVEVNDAPMTIIYPEALCGVEGEKGDRWHLAWNTVAADGTVGIRIPLMDWCKNLVYKLGRPIVSTSANISGEPTPGRFTEIDPAIKEAVDFVVPPSVDTQSTGKASQILKVGLRGEIEIIRK